MERILGIDPTTWRPKSIDEVPVDPEVLERVGRGGSIIEGGPDGTYGTSEIPSEDRLPPLAPPSTPAG